METAGWSALMEGIMAKVAELNLDLSTRFYVFVAGHFVLYYWMRYVVAPARPGWSRGVRAMILAPILAIMCILFDAQKNEEATTSVYSIATFLCMAPSKIICFCMNRGPIVKAYDSKSTLAFVLSLLFPVSVAFDEKKVTGKNEEKATEPHAYKDARFSVLRFEKTERWMRVTMLLFQTIGKIMLMLTLRHSAQYFHLSGQIFMRNVCIGWFVYAYGSAIEDTIGLVLLLTANVKINHNFDRPWLSQSVRELWSRRYNMVVSEILRSLSYEPIYEGCWVRGSQYFERKKPSGLRKSMALIAAFAASCFFHMGILMFISPFRVCPSHGFFFVANGLVIVLEDVVKFFVSKQKGGLAFSKSIPKLFWQIYAVSTVTLLGHLFFCSEFVEFGYVDVLMNAGLSFVPPN